MCIPHLYNTHREHPANAKQVRARTIVSSIERYIYVSSTFHLHTHPERRWSTSSCLMSIGAVGVPPCNGRVMSRSVPFAVDPSISRSEILHHPHDTSVCSIAAGRASRDLLRRPRAPPPSPSTLDAVLFMALTLRTTVASTKRKVRSRLKVEENRE